jgi:hypothetical protein
MELGRQGSLGTEFRVRPIRLVDGVTLHVPADRSAIGWKRSA